MGRRLLLAPHEFRFPGSFPVDTDGDGVADDDDAFPLDPTEWLDTDGDEIGNNADPDDDNDGYSDEVEIVLGTDPLDASSTPPEDEVPVFGAFGQWTLIGLMTLGGALPLRRKWRKTA